MDLGLTNKTAFITGASGGIGQAIARKFFSEDVNVVIHYKTNRASAQDLVDEFGNERSLAVQADLGDETAVKTVFSKAVEKFGAVDVLIANAGVWPPLHVPLHEMTVEQWQSTMQNNLVSVFLCCRQFIKQVLDNNIQAPAIVMIGSTAGIFGEAGHADYAAGKSALIHGLTLSLKNEIAQVTSRGRVNTVSPGWVLTPMAKKFADDAKALNQALSTIAMRKVGAPDDIANAVLFLSSSRVAGHITGQNLVVSGGMEGRRLYD